MRILVVDDDPLSSRMVQFLLTEQGHAIDLVDNARGALALVQKNPPDLLLLDVNMPHITGFDLYQRLRENGFDIPVIFVTAKHEVEDRVQGLRMGADDYICKPFQPAELAARVDAVLRRYRRTTPSGAVVQAGEWRIDAAALTVTLPDNKRITFTPTEMKVLMYLAQRPGQVVARDTLLLGVWGDGTCSDSNIVDVYIRRIRRKLERDPSRPVLIQSARGIGYKLDRP